MKYDQLIVGEYYEVCGCRKLLVYKYEPKKSGYLSLLFVTKNGYLGISFWHKPRDVKGKWRK